MIRLSSLTRVAVCILGATLVLVAACASRPSAEEVDARAWFAETLDHGEAAAPARVTPEPDRTAYGVVIAGGRVIDPASGFDAVADVGVLGDTVARVSEEPLYAMLTIGAEGLIVAPGFIDITIPSFPREHSHRNVQYWKLTDGVTTALWLHDGHGFVENVNRFMEPSTHLTNWGIGTRIEAYYSAGFSLEQKLEAIEANFRAGSLGLGSSPEYFPYITTDDMVEFARVADRYGAALYMHLRYSRRGEELDGVREAVHIAEASGAHVHIFHLPSTGGTFDMHGALEIIRDALGRGVRLTADVYPYSYWMTFINSARFAPSWRDGFGLDYEDLFLVPLRRTLTRELFDEYRRKGGLVVVPEGTIPWETSILPALDEDFVFIASDGSFDVSPFFGGAFASHPRNTGTFARALSLSRKHDIPIETIIRKITIDPARLLEPVNASFARRGRIFDGAIADITVFDPAVVDGMGTVLDAGQESIGIHAVLVNGVVSFRDGRVMTEGAGRYLRYAP